MGKKRKSVGSSLDEVDRTLYSFFSTGANALSQLYSQAINHQKLSFQAGERHALEKLYQWILRQQESGSRVTTVDILTYLQMNLDGNMEEPSLSPRAPLQNQHLQAAMPYTNSAFLVSSASAGEPFGGQGFRCEHVDEQSKNNVFSNALSSPVRQSLQNYHISQSGFNQNAAQTPANGMRNNDPNSVQAPHRETNPFTSNYSSMDMRDDSPDHESTF